MMFFHFFNLVFFLLFLMEINVGDWSSRVMSRQACIKARVGFVSSIKACTRAAIFFLVRGVCKRRALFDNNGDRLLG